MLFRALLACVVVTASVYESNAGPFRRFARTTAQPSNRSSYPSTSRSWYLTSATTTTGGASTWAAVASPSGDATNVLSAATAAQTPPVGFVANGSEGDGLDEVNAKRAACGLRPLVRDDGLTQAARACAGFRAERGLFGHTSNDFAFVPAGTVARSAGCAAYPASYGWMSCCVYENYTYAGAAWVTGRDGRRYMQLFVR